MLAYPEKFRQREIRQGGVRGELNDAFCADLLIQLAALRLGADVAPDERRTDYVVVGVEHDRAVHLAGKSYAGDVGALEIGLGERVPDGNAAGAPPVLRILLRPSDFRRGEVGVLFGCRCDHLAALVDDERAGSAGANVNAEQENKCLLKCALESAFSNLKAATARPVSV